MEQERVFDATGLSGADESACDVGPLFVDGRPARILIDARKILDGGIGIYTQNLIGGLLEHQIDLTLFGSIKQLETFKWSKQVHLIEEDTKPYSFEELFLLSKRIPFGQYDLFHTPHYVLPYGIPIPTVITVHDLIHIHHPEKWYYPYIATRLIRSGIRRARRVLVVSNATRQEVQRLIGKRAIGKVEVVPNALDPFFMRRSPTATEQQQPYFFSVLSMNKPHKGLRDLLSAYEIFRRCRKKSGGKEIRLVLGGKGILQAAEDELMLKKISEMKGVELLGYLSKEELRRHYRQSLAVVIPSLAEGFCLPVIEAQSQETPVVARPVAAIKENACGRDYIAKDFTIDALADEMSRVVAEKEHAVPSIAEHPQTIQAFSRNEIASIITSIYSEILNKDSA